MKAVPFLALLLVTLGCVSPPAPPKELPGAASRDYDRLWIVTRDVVEKHFDLFVQRKDEGYMVSTYKRGDPLPGPLAKDAQTGYDTVEELLHVVRRRLTVRILEDYPGVYVVHLEVIRERQGYVPPPRSAGTAYSLFDQRQSDLNDAADQTETVTWYRLGRDLHLEEALLNQIQQQLSRKSRT